MSHEDVASGVSVDLVHAAVFIVAVRVHVSTGERAARDEFKLKCCRSCRDSSQAVLAHFRSQMPFRIRILSTNLQPSLCPSLVFGHVNLGFVYIVVDVFWH